MIGASASLLSGVFIWFARKVVANVLFSYSETPNVTTLASPSQIESIGQFALLIGTGGAIVALICLPIWIRS